MQLLMSLLSLCMTNWAFLLRSSQSSDQKPQRRQADYSIVFDDFLERSEVRRVNWFCSDLDSCEAVVTDERIKDLDELGGAAREAASSLQRYSALYKRLSQSIQPSSQADQSVTRQRMRWNRNVVRFAAEQCDLNGRFCEQSFVEAMESLTVQDYQSIE